MVYAKPGCPNVRLLRKMLIMLLGKTWEDAELTLNSVEPTVQVGSTTCSFGARQAEQRALPVLEQSWPRHSSFLATRRLGVGNHQHFAPSSPPPSPSPSPPSPPSSTITLCWTGRRAEVKCSAQTIRFHTRWTSLDYCHFITLIKTSLIMAIDYHRHHCHHQRLIVCRYFIYGMQDSQNLERVVLDFDKFEIPFGRMDRCIWS